jgi:DNA-binding HxlR family transcriptional regulator
MGSKTYGQNCGLARALDILGERWTLLLLRELSLGPRRHKDIAAGLPGIGANLLSDRLRGLEKAGVIERVTLPPPAAVPGYALTAIGEELRPVLDRMAAWGLRNGDPFDEDDVTHAEWVLNSILSSARAAGFDRLDGIVQLEVGGQAAWIGPSPTGLRLHPGAAPAAASLSLAADAATLYALVKNELPLTEALDRGTLIVEGDLALAERLIEACKAAIAG